MQNGNSSSKRGTAAANAGGRNNSASAGTRRNEGRASTITVTTSASPNGVAGSESAESAVNGVGGVAPTHSNAGSSENGVGGRNSGIGAKRRGRPRFADNRTAPATGTAGTAGTAATEAQQANGLVVELEAPVIRKRRGKAKQQGSELSRQAILFGVGISIQGIFHALSFKLGQHWKLSDDETAQLATDLDVALQTLPEEYYAEFLAYIAKFAPWLAVCFTASGIIIPRIQKTAEQSKLNAKATTPTKEVARPSESEQRLDDASWRATTAINARVPSV